MSNVAVANVLRLEDFGLERLDEDRAITQFAACAEATITRWLDYARGALLFLMAPQDPESGWFCVFDRRRGAFYALDLPVQGHYGGFREDEFESMCASFGLKALARDPRRLRI